MVGLYVHIPFCSVKCFYCDFTAFSGQRSQADRYLQALEAEARLMPPRRPDTLYVGGGTPSELSAAQIRRLSEAVASAYPDSGFQEATFEANPESLDEEKLSALSAGGFGRLSLGLQTPDDALLRSVGRRHTGEDFARVFCLARSLGFSISVDLMYGLPGQTLEGFIAGLDRTLDLEPGHVSIYGLQVEDRTLFARRGVEADQDLGREMFEAALGRLARGGWRHYEISNFARPGRESLHNQIYWRGGEYVGLGCGAASYLDGVRFSNVDRLKEYCDEALAGRRPAVASERLEGKEKLGERAYLGLRLIEGFEPGARIEGTFAGEADALVQRGLLAREGSRWRLTREGVFLANDVAMAFVPPFGPAPKFPGGVW